MNCPGNKQLFCGAPLIFCCKFHELCLQYFIFGILQVWETLNFVGSWIDIFHLLMNYFCVSVFLNNTNIQNINSLYAAVILEWSWFNMSGRIIWCKYFSLLLNKFQVSFFILSSLEFTLTFILCPFTWSNNFFFILFLRMCTLTTITKFNYLI